MLAGVLTAGSEKSTDQAMFEQYRPRVVRYAEDDIFFQDGNECCASAEYSSSWCYSNTLYSKLMKKDRKTPKFVCGADGCVEQFTSVTKYVLHYETAHRNSCVTCGTAFPSSFLLDLHIRETHDSFFQAQAARGPMYECLIRGCEVKSASHADRGLHLVTVHGYPVEFNNIVCRGRGGNGMMEERNGSRGGGEQGRSFLRGRGRGRPSGRPRGRKARMDLT